jgi:DMSO reductase family type II enzyme heme b subunit
MRRNDLLLASVLAVVLVGAALVLPTITEARPAHEIPVYETSDGDSLSEPDGQEWTRTPAKTIPISSAGAAVPNGEDTTVEQITVEAALTDDRLFLRLTWPDATRDTSTDKIRAFADAVAIQIPTNASERPPIAMGGTDNTVNVWYWSGEGNSEELLAGGPGTTTQFENTELDTEHTYTDDRWRVVFSRPLDPSREHRTAVPTDQDLDIAFAAWNGSHSERSGQKAVSEWYYLALGPGPQGPPYEAILWTIAGIGIVITTLVTIQGIRRTRGE